MCECALWWTCASVSLYQDFIRTYAQLLLKCSLCFLSSCISAHLYIYSVRLWDVMTWTHVFCLGAVLNRFPAHRPAKSLPWSAVDLTGSLQRHLRGCFCSIPPLFVSLGVRRRLIESCSVTHTHTNTWAHRAIISSAVYFKRTWSPRKNTHTHTL